MSDGTENLRVLCTWSEVPAFDSSRAESEFWLHHALDPKLMNGSILKGDARESATVTLRFDPRLLARIKRVARSRYLNYQSMIKQWLAERLEQESRD
jgi:hypothetical protein